MASNQIIFPVGQLIAVLIILCSVLIIGSIGNVLVILVYYQPNRRRTCRAIRVVAPPAKGSTSKAHSGKRGSHTYSGVSPGNSSHFETDRLFILTMAVCDLCVCSVLVPFQIYMEITKFSVPNWFCKFYYIFSVVNVLYSTMLISVIAFDRYLIICHPLRIILSLKEAKRVLFFLSIFAGIFGAITSFNVQSHYNDTSPTNFVNISSNANFSKWQTEFIWKKINASDVETRRELNSMNKSLSIICEEIEYTKGLEQWRKTIYEIFKNLLNGFYLILLIVVIIFYLVIYSTILSVQRRQINLTKNYCRPLQSVATEAKCSNLSFSPKKIRLKNVLSKSNKTFRNESLSLTKSRPQIRQKLSIRDSSIDTVSSVPNPIKSNSPSASSINSNSPNFKSSLAFQHLKSAFILFVVTIVYIIAFLPALLINLGIISFNVILYDLYFVNNAVNPIIYCFMNSKFRNDLKRVLTESWQRHQYYRRMFVRKKGLHDAARSILLAHPTILMDKNAGGVHEKTVFVAKNQFTTDMHTISTSSKFFDDSVEVLENYSTTV